MSPSEKLPISPKRQQKLCIAIPASLTEDTPHLREKTYKVGLVGRAASTFRVEEVMIYFDKPRQNQNQDAEFTASILRYMDTPQYLRKALVKVEPRLRFVGILPPLRAPHHQVSGKRGDLKPGTFRQGVVTEVRGRTSLVDIGVGETAFVQGNFPKGHRITVKLTKIKDEIEAVRLDDAEIRIYWGFNVTVPKLPLAESTRKMGFDLVISTSRYGREINEVFPDLQSAWAKSKKTLVAFGSPAKGLEEILKGEGLGLKEYSDFSINMIPKQGVETVRTEEAIYASLSLLNILG